jgi:hypothetical protein
VKPDATPVGGNKAQFGFRHSKPQKAQLREHGYSDDDIAKMKSAEALRILGLA